VSAVNSQLGDKHFRASVRHMHQQGYPLVKMVEALGLDDDLSPELRTAIGNLSPEVVDDIRNTTLQMLDRAESRSGRLGGDG
jgi:hypothetical protein